MEKKYYDFKKEEDKEYFAIYTNLAVQNFSIVLKTITSTVLDKESNLKEEELWSNSPVILELKKSNNEVIQYRIIELLKEWMPVIVARTSNPLEIAKRLSACIKKLSFFRDYYSHYYSKSKLDISWRANAIDTKSSYDLEKFYKKAVDVLRDKLDKRLLVEYEGVNEVKKIQGVFVTKEQKEIFERGLKLLKPNRKEFSSNNFTLFISFFLQKHQIAHLIGNIKGLKNSTNIAFRAVRNAYFIQAIKPPQNKLKSENNKDSFVLNGLTELARCPKIVKPYLTSEAQKMLFIKEEEEVVENDVVLRKVEYLRHNDIFLHNALQFAELQDYFKVFQFQINLGKCYVKEPYEKNICGQEIKRHLKKDINVHGKLKDYDDAYYDELVDKSVFPPKFLMPLSFYKPRYILEHNRIGFNIQKDKTDVFIKRENFEKHKNDISSYIISEKGFMKMLYLRMHLKNDSLCIKTIKTFDKNFANFLTYILENSLTIESSEDLIKIATTRFNIIKSNIPNRIINFFKKDKLSLEEKIKEKLQVLLDENEFLSQAEKLPIEERKKLNGFFHFGFRAGELASWLTKDMLRLMKTKEVKRGEKIVLEKLNLGQVQLLQGKLAMLSSSPNSLGRVFSELELNSLHPFLSNVALNPPMYRGRPGILGIKSFVKRYLKERERWLQNELRILCDASLPLYDAYHYLDLRKTKTKKQYLKNYIEAIKERPLFLPNNLFDDAIRETLKVDQGHRFIKIILDQKGVAKQWFYNAKYFINKEKEAKRDAKLRYYQMQDFILWLMIKKASVDINFSNTLTNLSLSNYSESTSGGFNSNNILEREVPINIVYKVNDVCYTINATRKLRDYGVFRHYLKDRRVKGVLSYYKAEDTIPIASIKKEIDYYEQQKLLLLNKMYELEKRIFKANKEAFKAKIPSNKNSLNFRELINSFVGNNDKVEDIIEIRNKILHNQYPSKKELKMVFSKGGISEQFVFNVNKYLDELLNR